MALCAVAPFPRSCSRAFASKTNAYATIFLNQVHPNRNRFVPIISKDKHPITASTLPETLVRLVLAVDRHYPGYVDSYYGPPEWRPAPTELTSLASLRQEVEALQRSFQSDPGLDEQRRDYLLHEACAAVTILRQLQGEPLSLAEEVEGVYDLEISWTDESHFLHLRQQLADLLPGSGSLPERYLRFEKSLAIPPETVEPLARYALEVLHQRTDDLYHLPKGDSVELILPDLDEPWAGYHEYLGCHKSRVAVNTHYPQHLTNFIHILAHEAFPGHHTEHSIKEERLTRTLDRPEHTLVMANSPSCVISEGAAMLALETLFSQDDLVSWFKAEVFPRAGIKGVDPERSLQISRLARRMELLFANAVILMYDRRLTDHEVFDYIRSFSTESDENLHAMVDFMKQPVRRSYTFCYAYGARLMEDLYTARGDRQHWHLRAVSEPTTPSQIRLWIAGQELENQTVFSPKYS